MISKERLEELIRQNKKIFIVGDYKLKSLNLYCKCSCKRNGLYVNGYFVCKLYDLYETKEEAEFVARFYCEKTIEFRPPTFEKFYSCYSDSGILIDDFYEYFQVGRYEYGEIDLFDANLFNYEKDNIESKKQAYYQAVEYAKKLFLGEE